jgi:hypothetical protein
LLACEQICVAACYFFLPRSSFALVDFGGLSPNGAWAVAATLGFFFFGFLASRFRVAAFCHRNPPLNEARGCKPGVPREGRVFQFCKQPLEVGENIRDKRGPPRIFGGRRLRKQDQKITGLGHDFNPAGGGRGEKQVLQFLLARRQRGMVGVDRCEQTPRIPVAFCAAFPRRPSRSIVSYAKICSRSESCSSTGRINNPVDAAVHSPVRPAWRGRWPVLTTRA